MSVTYTIQIPTNPEKYYLQYCELAWSDKKHIEINANLPGVMVQQFRIHAVNNDSCKKTKCWYEEDEGIKPER